MKKLSRLISQLLIIALLSTFIPCMAVQAEKTNIKIGDYIQLGTYYGEPILWRCVDIDENGPLIFSDKIICIKGYDASGENTSGSHGRGEDKFPNDRKERGSNYWADSNIRCWLNSNDENVEWLCGNPPTAANFLWDGNTEEAVGNTEYADEQGFIRNFSSKELEVVKKVSQDCYIAQCDSKQEIDFNPSTDLETAVNAYKKVKTEKVKDTFFLLDINQLYHVYKNGDVLGENYYLAQPTEKAKENMYYEENKIKDSAKWRYWLRTPQVRTSQNVRFVDSDGQIWSDQARENAIMGIRPAFYLNESKANFKRGDGSFNSPYSVKDRGFNIKEDGWSFANSEWSFSGQVMREGIFDFDLKNEYYIPIEIYEQVFGKAYIETNNITTEQLFGGFCEGMSDTAIYYHNGLLNWDKIDNSYDETFDTVNSYYDAIGYYKDTAFSRKQYYVTSNPWTEVTRLIQCYQLWGNHVNFPAIYDEINSKFHKFEIEQKNGAQTKSVWGHFEYEEGGTYVKDVLSKIQKAVKNDIPLNISLIYQEGGHAIVARTDKMPEYEGDGWWKVFVYDPNKPYINDNILDNIHNNDSNYQLFQQSCNNILNNGNDIYMELNPDKNLWRYNTALTSDRPDKCIGTDENGNIKLMERTAGNYTEISPEYFYVIDPTSFFVGDFTDSSYSWLSTNPWLPSKSDNTQTIVVNNNAKFEIYSTSRELLAVVENGVAIPLSDDIKYYPNNNSSINENETTGYLSLKKDKYDFEVKNGSLKIWGHDNVINLKTENCDISATMDIAENKLDIVSNSNGTIELFISNVNDADNYDTYKIKGDLKVEESISVAFPDNQELQINNANSMDIEHKTDKESSAESTDSLIQCKTSDWARLEVEEAYEKGLIPESLIDQDLTQTISRAEFADLSVTLYEKMSGKKAQMGENPFDDIDSHVLKNEILKAYDLGITQGTSSNLFEPDYDISREQLATMLCRAIKKVKFEDWDIAKDFLYILDVDGISKFSDDEDISDFAKESVYFMAKHGIVKGIDNSRFAPQNMTSEHIMSNYADATREQGILIALRCFKTLLDVESDTLGYVNSEIEVSDGQNSEYISVASGDGHILMLREDDSLWACGLNNYGQVGDGTYEDKYISVKIMDDVKSIATGSHQSYAIKKDGSLWAWGSNLNGELGTGTPDDECSPVKIMDNVKCVSSGSFCTYAITNDNNLWYWGGGALKVVQNDDGWNSVEIDVSKYEDFTPEKIMSNIIDVFAGDEFTFVIKEDGSLWAWGDNSYGQLGCGETGEVTEPVKIMDNVSKISAGNGHSLAIKKDGSLWAWGDNECGQIGNKTTESVLIPVKIMDNVKDIYANGTTAVSGDGNSFALKNDGTLWAWGDNFCGVLGDGTEENKISPIKIMENVKDFSIRQWTAYAIKKDGSLWAWGNNSNGQFGNGTDVDQYLPIRFGTK